MICALNSRRKSRFFQSELLRCEISFAILKPFLVRLVGTLVEIELHNLSALLSRLAPPAGFLVGWPMSLLRLFTNPLGQSTENDNDCNTHQDNDAETE